MIKKKKLKTMGNYGGLDNYNYSNYKPTIIDKIQGWWKSFWWKYQEPNYPISYGGGPQGHYKFRWQRLQNIIIILMIVISFFILKIIL